MANWYTPFWLGMFCLVAGCGVSVIPSEETSSAEPGEVTASPTPPPQTATPPPEAQSQNSPDSLPSASARSPLQDTTIIPGERVGPVTRDTSRADLASIFGEMALEDTEIPVGEGFTESGTRVDLGNGQGFSVIWVDSSQSRPATVKDFGSAWETPEGIHIGTSFADLQTVLGNFDLYGFGWDYGGTVVLEGSALSDYYGSLILRLQPADAAVYQRQAEAFQAVQGDQLFSSNNPNLPPLDLAVNEMIVNLNSPGE